jgi:hypothetical protein
MIKPLSVSKPMKKRAIPRSDHFKKVQSDFERKNLSGSPISNSEHFHH